LLEVSCLYSLDCLEEVFSETKGIEKAGAVRTRPLAIA
jgi:hypothetical protein